MHERERYNLAPVVPMPESDLMNKMNKRKKKVLVAKEDQLGIQKIVSPFDDL